MIERFDERLDELVSPAARVDLLCSGAVWAEGPVYLPDDGAVVWSDIPNDRLLRWSPSDGMTVFRSPSVFTNGNTLDHEGRIVHCSHGQRAVTRTERDGSVTTVVDRWHGLRLNSPNDVVVHADGSVWFTDPPYGIVIPREGYPGESEVGANHVYRFDPISGELRAVVTDVEEPNGLAFSPDGGLLYVADTSAAHGREASGNHHIRVYRMNGRRALDGRVFAVIEPGLADGLRVDSAGNVYTSSADSIQVYAPDGTRLGKIGVPEPVSNCCWGGQAKNVLFITATTSLYSVETTATGAGLHW